MPPEANSAEIPPPPAGTPTKPLNPTVLVPEAVARILTATGGKAIKTDMIQAAIDASAPVLATVRVNLIELMA